MASAPTALVTGAAGFIGSHLTRVLLEQNWRVMGVDNFDLFYPRAIKERNLHRLSSARFEFVESDICDRARMREIVLTNRPALIVHLAALAGVRPSIECPDRYARVNVDGLVSMLDAAREAKVRPFVFASSSSVYGNASSVPFREDDRADEPLSPYAATKRSGELLCRTYASLFGLSIASLRFFTVFGPAQRPDLAIASFMRRIAAEEELPVFGDGTTSRDYTYIDDIVDGVCRAAGRVMEAEAGYCRIFNLGGSHPVTLDEMIGTIASVVGKAARVRRLPMQPGDVLRTWADLDRSERELGYTVRTDFRTGVERQWAWLRDHGD